MGCSLYAIFLLCVVAAGLMIVLAVTLVKLSDEKETVTRLKRRIGTINHVYCKDEAHRQAWNRLWDVIKLKFNFYRKEDKTWHGGQPVQEIFKTMRAEFGSFTKEQIKVVENIIHQIANAQANQHPHQLDKDIVFDGEGGFKIVDKLKPSEN